MKYSPLILFPEAGKIRREGICNEAQIRRANLYLLQQRASRIIRPCSRAKVLLGGEARRSSAGSRLQPGQAPGCGGHPRHSVEAWAGEQSECSPPPEIEEGIRKKWGYVGSV